MDIQTILNIVLSAITVWLAYRNFFASTRRDTIKESEEMTRIRTQLDQVMDLLRDMQKDIRTSSADLRMLDKQVTVMEMKLEEAFTRLEKLEGKDGK